MFTKAENLARVLAGLQRFRVFRSNGPTSVTESGLSSPGTQPSATKPAYLVVIMSLVRWNEFWDVCLNMAELLISFKAKGSGEMKVETPQLFSRMQFVFY